MSSGLMLAAGGPIVHACGLSVVGGLTKIILSRRLMVSSFNITKKTSFVAFYYRNEHLVAFSPMSTGAKMC